MKRSWTLWLVFAGCATLMIAALAWVSLIVIRLEEAGLESRKQARLEENTRLALWRMETMLAPIIAQENARPYYSYQAFFPAERAYTRMMAQLGPNEILIPSPLLTERFPYVRLYFQLGPNGELSSPQIPTSLLHGKAIEGYSTAEQIRESAGLLKRFGNSIPKQALRDVAPTEWLPPERQYGAGNEVASVRKDERRSALDAKSTSAQLPKEEWKKQAPPPSDKDAQQALPLPQKSPAQFQSQFQSKTPIQFQNAPPSQAQIPPQLRIQTQSEISEAPVNMAQEALRNSPLQAANRAIIEPQKRDQLNRNELEYVARMNAQTNDVAQLRKDERRSVFDDKSKSAQLPKKESLKQPLPPSNTSNPFNPFNKDMQQVQQLPQKSLPPSGSQSQSSQSRPNLMQEAMNNIPLGIANQIITVPQQIEQTNLNDVEYNARINTGIMRDGINIQRMVQNDGRNTTPSKQTGSKAQIATQASVDTDTIKTAEINQKPEPLRAKEEIAPYVSAGKESAQIATRAYTKTDDAKTAEVHQKPAPLRARDEIAPQVITGKESAQRGSAPSSRPSLSSIVSQPAEIKTSLLKAVWVHNELLLVRRIMINRDEYLQGCWLDWTSLQSWLIAGIQDLLPQAQIEASRNGNDQGRSLAALPIVIQPGPFTAALAPLVSPLRFSLWVAWFCVIAAILATAILLWGTHALSERRGAFVSAVTHELRTPLTTFRLYTEMLAEGMVPDAEQRRQYFATLRHEADRQYHLIENVLAYSRIERGRYGGHKEIISLGEWLARIQPRLMELAERSSMTLVPADEKELTYLQLLTDAAALERILFNLVDNACKYARSAADRRIQLEAAPEGNKVRIRIRDHGPGIAARDIARLFKPFHKSARDAANTSPGVGLGLSLCRRLAQSIGGELSLEQNSAEGASFSLLLPYPPQK